MPGPHDRLKELGLELPQPPGALAAYIPTRLVPIGPDRALVYISGQVWLVDGRPPQAGLVPDQVTVEQAQEAARRCAVNILAQLEAAAGLDRVELVAEVTGYVASAPGFGEQPRVLNGASELLVAVLGEAGRHTRAAVGVGALPLGVPVEVAAVAVVRTS